MTVKQHNHGSVMLEFVIAFPILLVLIFACIQFALLLMAKQVVHYAAFCAARTALVSVCDPPGHDEDNDSWPEAWQLAYAGMNGGRGGLAASEAEWAACKAAAMICSNTIAIWNPTSAADGNPEQKTRAFLVNETPTNIIATVEHDYALVVPVIGPILAWAMNPWDLVSPWSQANPTDDTGNRWPGFPHIRLRETVVLPKPYWSMIAAGNWREPGQW